VKTLKAKTVSGDMDTTILDAIRGSRISIVVFCKGYAFSKWCLDEPVEIMHRKN
jgi:hypothetical protein